MSDPVQPAASQEAPPVAVETPAPAPLSPAPAATEAAESAPASPSESAASPAPLPPAQEEKAAPHPADIPTLLEGAGKKTNDATDGTSAAAADVKPEGDKSAAAESAPAPAPEPVKIEWDLKWPETIKADEKQTADFTGALESLIRPKEGETPSHAAQRLIDMHNEAMVAYDKQVRQQQIDVWNQTRQSWVKQALADPMIGGAGHDTAMSVIARMRDLFVSDHKPGTKEYAADEKEFNDFLRVTGAGDHPAFLKFAYRVGARFDEPTIPAPGAKPTKTNGANPNRRSLYSNTPPSGS